jgi:RNA polymerase sigma-32 factor
MTLSLLTPNQKMLTPEEEANLLDEWITIRDGNSPMRERVLLKIITAFSPLVSKYVRKYAAYGINKEDLLSVGNLALVEVAKRFKPEKNFKFSTYASHWIKGMILIYVASNYFAFTLKNQKTKKIFFKLRKMLHQQSAANADISMTEMMNKLSEFFGVSATKLEQIYDLIQHPSTSMQQPAYSRDDRGETMQFGDAIPTEEPDPETYLIDKRMANFRKSILYTTMQEVLNDRERTILTGQMLTEEQEVQTLQDLADTFKLSRERVRQIRNNALDKLKRAIRTKCTDIEPHALFS